MNAPDVPPPGTSYTDRIMGAVMDAIIKESISTASDGTRVAALISRDIVEALLTVEATLLATSPDLAKPNGLRRFCEDHVKRCAQFPDIESDTEAVAFLRCSCTPSDETGHPALRASLASSAKILWTGSLPSKTCSAGPRRVSRISISEVAFRRQRQNRRPATTK
jgi:hypothetical protein